MHTKQRPFMRLTLDGFYYSAPGGGREECCVTDKSFPSNVLHYSKHGSYMVSELLVTIRMLDRTLTKIVPNEVLTRSKVSISDRVQSKAYIRLNKEPE